MVELIRPTRAKVGYLEVDRPNGTRGMQHIIPSHGLYSTKEMEKVMREIANEVGVPEDRVRVEAYNVGQSPLEANPRHRGRLPEWTRKPVRLSKPTTFQRRVFGGFGPGTLTRYRLED